MFKIVNSNEVMSLVIMALSLLVLIVSHNYFKLDAKVDVLKMTNDIKEKELFVVDTVSSSLPSISPSTMMCTSTPIGPDDNVETIVNDFNLLKTDLRNLISNNQLYESTITASVIADSVAEQPTVAAS